jgi:hypothetical protein
VAETGDSQEQHDKWHVEQTHLFRVVKRRYWDALHAKLRELGRRVEETTMTIADQLRKEGIEVGIKKGRIATLRSQLLFKFKVKTLDARHEACLRTATAGMLDRYGQRVLSAESLAAVFEDG